MEKIEELIKRPKVVGFVDTGEENTEESVVELNDVLFLEEYSEKKSLILDVGCPKSLVGQKWLHKYLAWKNMSIENLKKRRCSQKFKFGPSKVYESTELIEIPLNVQQSDGVLTRVYLEVFVVDADNVPLLCGLNSLKKWKAVLDLEQDILTTNVDKKKEFGCVQTPGGHLVIQLFVEDDWTTDETVFLMNEEIDYAENVKRIHEVTNHKSEANMLHAYRNAGRLTDEIRKKIKSVVETCKVCQKFKRSQGRPKSGSAKSDGL